MKKTIPIEKIAMKELESILQRAETAPLDAKDRAKLKAVFESYLHLTDLVEDKQMTIKRLRQMLFGAGTEKTREVIKEEEGEPESPPATGGDSRAPPENTGEEGSEPKQKRKGHGRNGADAYTGAEKIRVPHESLQPGDLCPECKKGTVYQMKKPGVLIRIVGQAPVAATVFELQKLRCHLCGKVFTAEPPEGADEEKYDATAASMIALLKYGSGLPFNRLEGLQGNLGIPLPASTQWDIVSDSAKAIEPVYEELIRQAAQGEVLYNDDTSMKILELMGKRAKAKTLAEDAPEGAKDAPKRTGIFTSGIVSTKAGRSIALFFTGRRHAGENLAEVLHHRSADLSAPIQMCDALSRNEPKEFETILANCIAHGRRQFVDVVENFPDECRYVLEALREVYKNDAVACQRNLSPDERLRFHQAESGPLMAGLKDWLAKQIEDHLVEPNSGLGEAITYMLKHWNKLTLFLREPGAPLDNNIAERALKRAILHRKNAMFYLSENGAHVGDLFMSLIYTCQLCDINPFDYLTELLRHAATLSANPRKWMPWNYRETLKLPDTTANATCG
ncbi:MAG: IS66 family transposase [bacterium]|nr:IS66 family transposase [bacterium]